MLVARHCARRLETPDQTRGSQRGAGGRREPALMHDPGDRACVGVRMVAHRGPHCYENTQSTPRNKHFKVESRFRSGSMADDSPGL
ncbi:hypothetical protein GCM10010381_53860 [Streptomyces xantholiticus]|nr:hypothetical protein GCM10010381_53860 [Streptomyces xantholiticus]